VAIACSSPWRSRFSLCDSFEEACDELWAWLNNALWQLGDMDPDAVAAQLSKHKVTVMLAVV